jgi:aryl-alcohol dehydrogenase-like predicted oxidoreductase
MKNRPIPRTSISVSPICLGTMTFGTPVGEADAIKLIHHAFDKGVNFIDTANMYEGYARFIGSPGGVGEVITGKAVKGNRKDYVIATKVGMKVGDQPEDEGTSPAAIRKHLDLSLKRLDTDYVDIYYFHRWDTSAPLVDMVAAVAEAIKAGKVLHYGISNYTAEQTAEILKVADANGLPRPVIHQPDISLIHPDLCEDLLPLCAKEQIAVAPYRVLASGLLTGKYQRGAPVPPDSRKVEKEGWMPEFNDALFDKLEAIEDKAKAEGATVMQYALRWMLRQPAVVSNIIGVKRADQIDDAVDATANE